MHLLLLLAIGLLGGERTIDDFHYDMPQAARDTWSAGSGTPPVDVVRDEGPAALQVTAPFATNPGLVRVFIERKVKLDLADADEIILDVASHEPKAAGGLTLYFRSGGGWYVGDRSITKKGRQTLHLSKARFRAEDNPAGWDRIDGIRIAMWRGPRRDTSFRLSRLAAVSRDASPSPLPGPTREGRAIWNHSGTGAYPGDWDRSAKELAAAGFNMVLPNMLWAGQAHYPSDVLPRSATFRKHGDQLAQCTTAAKKHGLEVHVWKVNYNLSGAPKEFVAKLRREGRTQVDVKGEPQMWLCPSHPENKRLELESMLEVARRYPVDGLHFDYIRYPGSDRCFCDGCRHRFEAATGQRVADWPADCYRGDWSEAYNDWRCRQITDLVAAVHREGKRLRSTLKISAAVFGEYPACRRSMAQDWPEWIKAGYLDFVCPMNYTEDDAYFIRLLKNQIRLADGRIPIYPGIGATAANSKLTAERVMDQIRRARSLGAQGFTIFNYNSGSATSIVPNLRFQTKRVEPPH